MIYEKIKISDICSKLKESKAVISAYIPDNSEEININKKSQKNTIHFILHNKKTSYKVCTNKTYNLSILKKFVNIFGAESGT